MTSSQVADLLGMTSSGVHSLGPHLRPKIVLGRRVYDRALVEAYAAERQLREIRRVGRWVRARIESGKPARALIPLSGMKTAKKRKVTP